MGTMVKLKDRRSAKMTLPRQRRTSRRFSQALFRVILAGFLPMAAGEDAGRAARATESAGDGVLVGRRRFGFGVQWVCPQNSRPLGLSLAWRESRKTRVRH